MRAQHIFYCLKTAKLEDMALAKACPVHQGVLVDLPSPSLDYLGVREGGVPQRPYLSPPPDSAKRRARRAFGNRG